MKTVRILGPLVQYLLDVEGVPLRACTLNDPAVKPAAAGSEVQIVVAPEHVQKLTD